MGKHIRQAFVAALLAGVLIAPIFGFQILRVGLQTTIRPDWGMIFTGMALVFAFQLLRPLLRRALAHSPTKSIHIPPPCRTRCNSLAWVC